MERTGSPAHEGDTRRGLLSKAGKLSVGVFAGLAGLKLTEGKAFAACSDPCTGNYACCHLALPNKKCAGSGQTFSCPSGYTKWAWSCCCWGSSWGCGECQKGSTYACSYGYGGFRRSAAPA